jgi:hypothetical protein
MKLTFKVWWCRRMPSSITYLPLFFQMPTLTTLTQDLKQQKFIIEAEPSELVRIYFYPFSISLQI